MRKSEIQSSRPRELGIDLVITLLLRRHRIPLLLSQPILRHIVGLRKKKNRDRDDIDDDELRVTTMIQRLVILPVNEGRTDTAELDHHVIERGTDGACSHVVGIL